MESAAYVLPNAERYDRQFSGGTGGDRLATVTDTVVQTPVASERTRDVYDQTSIWAVSRGAAGELSLITPQTGTWHDLGFSDPFAPDPNDEAKRWLEGTRDYLFSTRANPRSGFWPSHKAALRCKWAFGTAVMFVRDAVSPTVSAPISYVYIPLSENYLATNFEGIVDTNYRLFTLSARQAVQQFGPGALSSKVADMANDPKERDKPITILHAVQPRAEAGRYGSNNRNSPFSSCYIEVDQKRIISEAGYFEFPYRVDHWERTSTRPYEEGPVSLCLAEIKSLNEMAKSELISSQQSVNPPIASHEDVAGVRLDLNPGAVNPGYMSAEGRPLAAPLVTQQRPDFAQAVLEARRTQIRTTLYIDLWQTIIDSKREMTAFEARLRAQEKADALGPIGTSSQVGLYFQVERELGILTRMGAFGRGSPLEAPEQVRSEEIGARFTSPLDKARKLGEFQAATQLVTIGTQLEGIRPGTMDKFDIDEFVDYSQETLGAPRRIMATDDDVAEVRQARQEAAQAEAAAQEAVQGATAVGGVAAAADALSKSPAASSILEQLAGV